MNPLPPPAPARSRLGEGCLFLVLAGVSFVAAVLFMLALNGTMQAVFQTDNERAYLPVVILTPTLVLALIGARLLRTGRRTEGGAVLTGTSFYFLLSTTCGALLIWT